MEMSRVGTATIMCSQRLSTCSVQLIVEWSKMVFRSIVFVSCVRTVLLIVRILHHRQSLFLNGNPCTGIVFVQTYYVESLNIVLFCFLPPYSRVYISVGRRENRHHKYVFKSSRCEINFIDNFGRN